MPAPLRRATLLLLLLAGALSAAIPTPEAFAGFPLGSDGNLLRWVIEALLESAGLIPR